VNTLKLSSTSALVLLWAGQDCYRSEWARNFLGRLNLEEGRPLYEKCAAICPYYDQVIKNRKFGVFHLIEQAFSDRNGHYQVIIAGAGLDALGIEVTERYPNVKVFELDRENMGWKFNLYGETGDISKPKIFFIETDLLTPSSVYKSLVVHGWDSMKETLMIFEGISYYLPAEILRKLVRVVRPDWAIVEFLKQNDKIDADKAVIPKKIFDVISNECGLSHIKRYSGSELEKYCADMSVSDTCSMKFLEMARTGANRYFPAEDSGWIEVCLLAK